METIKSFFVFWESCTSLINQIHKFFLQRKKLNIFTIWFHYLLHTNHFLANCKLKSFCKIQSLIKLIFIIIRTSFWVDRTQSHFGIVYLICKYWRKKDVKIRNYNRRTLPTAIRHVLMLKMKTNQLPEWISLTILNVFVRSFLLLFENSATHSPSKYSYIVLVFVSYNCYYIAIKRKYIFTQKRLNGSLNMCAYKTLFSVVIFVLILVHHTLTKFWQLVADKI